MFLSVIVCTRERPRLLTMTLDRMCRLRVPPRVTWELLVVNNGPSEAIDRLIDVYADRLPVRRLREARPGKSHALNRAVSEARGDYLLFTDDDALVEPDWLAAYAEAFARSPDASVFGGPITAEFERPPPRWLLECRDRLSGVYAERDFGPDPVPLSSERVPFGVNLAIRAADHARYRYPSSLGPGPGDMVRGEDTAVVRAMLADGRSGWWVPDARVCHVTPSDRLTTRYVRQYFVGHGRQLAAQETHDGAPTLLGRPRWVWRAAFEATVRFAFHRVRRKPAAWVPALIAASVAWGRLVGPRKAGDMALRVRTNSLEGRDSSH